MDPLSRILASVRLRANVLSVAELASPFGVSTSGVDGADRRGSEAAIFHAVVTGEAFLVSGASRVALAAGDVVVLSRGQAHDLVHPASARTTPIGLLPRIEGPVPIVRSPRGDPSTRIVCGIVRIDHAASASLLSLLPEVMHHESASASPEARDWVLSTIRLLDLELRRGEEGSGAVAARLCDVLFVQLLRSSKVQGQGWLAALTDPQIGKALALIHEDPRTRWDATILAERVGLSRTRFFARFTELVGEPPAQYLSRWRMADAADRLSREDLTVVELAEQVGYASEDAFVRVFKRHFGLTPSAYRKQRGAPAGLRS